MVYPCRFSESCRRVALPYTRKAGGHIRGPALRRASNAVSYHVPPRYVTCSSTSNGSTAVMPSIQNALQTSSVAVLTTFTFPAALAGEDVTLLGAREVSFDMELAPAMS